MDPRKNPRFVFCLSPAGQPAKQAPSTKHQAPSTKHHPNPARNLPFPWQVTATRTAATTRASRRTLCVSPRCWDGSGTGVGQQRPYRVHVPVFFIKTQSQTRLRTYSQEPHRLVGVHARFHALALALALPARVGSRVLGLVGRFAAVDAGRRARSRAAAAAEQQHQQQDASE